MLLLLLGTLAFFIPHTFLVGVRELLGKLKELKRDQESEDQQDVEPVLEPSGERDVGGDDRQGSKQDIRDAEPSDGQSVEPHEHDNQKDLKDDKRDDKHED